MNSLSRRRTVRTDEENPYWISFSDLMAALLVIFILAVISLILALTENNEKLIKQRDQNNQNIEQLRGREQAIKGILYGIRDELAKQNIIVNISENDTVLRIPHKTLSFGNNRDEIPFKFYESLEQIGLTVHRKINELHNKSENSSMRYLDTVFIEGHTDSLPTKRFKGNWGLSSDRAVSVWDFWRERLSVTPSFSEMTNASGQKLFSVSGYASSRRLQLIEETPAQRLENRRIDIRFTVKPPSIEEMTSAVVQ